MIAESEKSLGEQKRRKTLPLKFQGNRSQSSNFFMNKKLSGVRAGGGGCLIQILLACLKHSLLGIK